MPISPWVVSALLNTIKWYYNFLLFQGSPTKDISTEDSPKKDKKKKKGLRTPSFLKKKKEKKKSVEA